MDTGHEMVSASYKHTFKIHDTFNSIEAAISLQIKPGETPEQTYERAWAIVQKQVEDQVKETVASVK